MYAANSPRGWRSAAATFTCVSILSPVGRYFGVRGPRISISAASNVPPGFGCLVLAFLFEGTSLLRGLDNCLVSMRLLSFVGRKGSTRATMSATDVSETSQLALQASGSGPDQSSASAAAAERQRSILCLKRAWRLAAALSLRSLGKRPPPNRNG